MLAVNPDEPNVTASLSQSREDRLALMGIHPWLRLSNHTHWCRHSPPAIHFRRLWRSKGEIVPIVISKYRNSPIVKELHRHGL